MKICSKCKVSQPSAMYSRSKNTYDGFHSQCKDCDKKYRLANKEAISLSSKEYCLRTKEARSLYRKDYRSRNKEALANKDREYYLRTKEKRLAYGTEYRSRNKEALALRATKKYHRTKKTTQINTMANWEQHMLHNTKANAKRRGRVCTLILSDITIPDKCPYLNVPLTRIVGNGQLSTNASIDRIDSAKGYTPDNTQVISRLANTMKNSATKEQLNVFARNILKLHPVNKGE